MLLSNTIIKRCIVLSEKTTKTITTNNLLQSGKSLQSLPNRIQDNIFDSRYVTFANKRYFAASSDSSSSTSSSSSSSSSTTTPSNPSSSSSSSSSSTTTAAPKDSLHSTDIAYKPTKDGWGYNPKYSQSWDNVFSSIPNKEESDETMTSSAAASGGGKAQELVDSEVNGSSSGEEIESNKRLERIVNDALLLSKKDQIYIVDVLSEKLGLKK